MGKGTKSQKSHRIRLQPYCSDYLRSHTLRVFRTSDSRETVVVFLLYAELIPAAEPVVLVALGQGAAVGQDEVRAQVGDDGAEAARPVGLCRHGRKCGPWVA